MNTSVDSVESIEKFCVLCDELFSVWQLRKYMFDENPYVDLLTGPRHGHFFLLLQNTLQESWIYKLGKLHDPAVQNSSMNLSIPCLVEFGKWHPDFKSKLVKIQNEMKVLSESLRNVRNKVWAHNDLKSVLSEKSHGAFEVGQDELYFQALRNFTSAVSEKVLGYQFDYTDMVQNDVEIFMNDFVCGIAGIK